MKTSSMECQSNAKNNEQVQVQWFTYNQSSVNNDGWFPIQWFTYCQSNVENHGSVPELQEPYHPQ
jgi:hypothetical protein